MKSQGLFMEIDISLAKYLSREPSEPAFLKDLISLLSYRLRQGHSCLDLAFPDWTKEELAMLPSSLRPWPDITFFKEHLSAATGVDGDFTPLILDGSTLYFHRFFLYEKELAKRIIHHAGRNEISIEDHVIAERIEQYFPETDIEDNDQVRAIQLALRSRMFLLCGGPGTGKTTTVVKLLCMILQLANAGNLPRIALAAPTGKAAMRLKESLDSQLKTMDSVNAELINKALQSTGTLHRLLKINPVSGRSQYSQVRKLPVDVLVVDECSMIDLGLMGQLMEGISDETHLILIGDFKQLASVEVGSIFSDLVRAAKINGFPAMFTLRKNYRFADDSGIGQLCSAIHDEDFSRMQVCIEETFPDLKIVPHPKNILAALEKTLDSWTAFFDSEDPSDALNAFHTFRILGTTYEGNFGVKRMNAVVGDIYCRKAGIQKGSRLYHRMPVLITENDPATGLFNGEIGVIWQNSDGSMRAFFADGKGGLRSFSPQQLPAWTLAWAMTIHRSQGSEFNDVLIVLPDTPIGLLSRELVYTGLSRARFHATVWSKKDILLGALKKPVARASGLTERLGRRETISEA